MLIFRSHFLLVCACLSLWARTCVFVCVDIIMLCNRWTFHTTCLKAIRIMCRHYSKILIYKWGPDLRAWDFLTKFELHFLVLIPSFNIYLCCLKPKFGCSHRKSPEKSKKHSRSKKLFAVEINIFIVRAFFGFIRN